MRSGSRSRAERDGIVGALARITDPEGGAAALVVRIRIRVRAVSLCDDVTDVSGAHHGTVLVNSLK